jgi:hypothetical protein
VPLPRRNLRVKASQVFDKTGIATDVTNNVLEDVDQFLSRDIRDKFFDWAEKNIQREVAKNIARGKENSGYPMSWDINRRGPEGRLLRSLVVERSESLDQITVSLGKGLPYNRSYAAKRTERIQIEASGRFLKFPQRRKGQRRRGQSSMIRRKRVSLPGRDILGEALEDTQRKAPAKLQSLIREQRRSLGRSKKYKVSSDGVKIYVGGAKRKRTR